MKTTANPIVSDNPRNRSAIAYTYQPETVEAIRQLDNTCPGTVSHRAMATGAANAEPVLIILDAAIRWIKAYRTRFDDFPGNDYMARHEIGAILAGARALLNFDGGYANEAGLLRDSKDNGTLENLYWTACELAGLDGNDL